MKKIFVVIIVSLFFASCSEKISKISRPLMGTEINLSLVGDKILVANASEKAFAEIARIEKLMSSWKKGTDISKINKDSWRRPVLISEETYSLIKQSIELSELTNGAFDISYASIAFLWNYKDKNFTIPSDSKIKKYLPRVNYKNIRLYEIEKAVSFKKRGMKIALGAIAKGYAIKQTVKVLKKAGIKAGIAEEGGDLQVFGDNNGRSWKTGVMHPRKNSLLLIIDLYDMDSIATSGDYARVVKKGKKRYHHIINPRTGKPTETLASVSVICKDPVLADSIATAIFVLGIDGIKKISEKYPELNFIVMDLDMNLYISKNLEDRIKLIEKTKINWL